MKILSLPNLGELDKQMFAFEYEARMIADRPRRRPLNARP
jgi:hypothetical protein